MKRVKVNGDGAYTEANSGGVAREGCGYFSSRIPTITSESDTHLPSNLATGTFPSGFASKNLSTTTTKKKKNASLIPPQGRKTHRAKIHLTFELI